MGFSLDNQQSQSEQYQAPDPMFITTVMALAQGFPWGRFERFFESRPLIKASAVDQVFLMRVLALQEMLCLDDAEVLMWVKNQLYLFAFISPNYKPKMPSEALLEAFRQRLDELNILQPFRKRCQRVILKHGTIAEASRSSVAFSGALTGLADMEPFPRNTRDQHSPGNLELTEIEERWVACPLCNSAKLSEYVPTHLRVADCEPWANCQECGHKFKIG